jgi:hypothetical protein
MAHRTRPRPPTPGVVAWRADRLGRAGFEPATARRLAADPARDLHALIDLVERGCPPALAIRILAPLDDPGEP